MVHSGGFRQLRGPGPKSYAWAGFKIFLLAKIFLDSFSSCFFLLLNIKIVSSFLLGVDSFRATEGTGPRTTTPDPLKNRRSTHAHSFFQISLPNTRTLSHKSSFIPRTCNLWDLLPSSCFPESYNLPSSKSKMNKLDLISRSS